MFQVHPPHSLSGVLVLLDIVSFLGDERGQSPFLLALVFSLKRNCSEEICRLPGPWVLQSSLFPYAPPLFNIFVKSLK